MKYYYDKEYHPVIEEFIVHYSEDSMSLAERDAFVEVLVHDDDLRELAHSAKEGKKLLESFVEVAARAEFTERLMSRIEKLN